MSAGRTAELLNLLEALCEERITAPQMARLEQMVRADRALRRVYLDYIDLHGTLYWDAARSATILSRVIGSIDLELTYRSLAD